MNSSSKNNETSYVLVTTARDEEKHLPLTIESVLIQDPLPLEWVLVDDGSVDATGKIAEEASQKHSWIKVVRRLSNRRRSFDSVVSAINKGIQAISRSEYKFLGILDADVLLPPGYFAEILTAFNQNPNLGIAGGIVLDPGESLSRLPRNVHDIPGATQFFRRECYESLGGLIPLQDGGWDMLSCTYARMQGWQTKMLTHLVVKHLKPRNEFCGLWFKRFAKFGIRDRALGYDPFFELLKCIDRIRDRPWLIGSALWFVGYIYACIFGESISISPRVLRYIRAEQRRRIKSSIISIMKLVRTSVNI